MMSFSVIVFQTKNDEKLDTRRAVVVVETILSHFSERRYLITDYYEHWKVHVVSGKEFKTQWQQFIQDARKVRYFFSQSITCVVAQASASLYIFFAHHQLVGLSSLKRS
jgi:hypothetical protein